MTEPQFFYRDDDADDRKRVGKEIEKGGCESVLWETLEELRSNWHNNFVGGATDDQIKHKGMITSGAEDIRKQKEIAELECPLVLLTNISNIKSLEIQYNKGPNGTFQEYFNKEDSLIDGSFCNFVKECRLSKSTEEERLAAYRITLKDLDLGGEPTQVLINQNEVTFPAHEQLGVMQTWDTLDDMCDPVIFQGLSAESQKGILDKISTLIKNHYLNSSE